MTTISLTHYENGPMEVAVWDEATWWMGKRQWTCPDDPERGSFEDGDFEESKAQIEAALAAASEPYRELDEPRSMREAIDRAFSPPWR